MLCDRSYKFPERSGKKGQISTLVVIGPMQAETWSSIHQDSGVDKTFHVNKKKRKEKNRCKRNTRKTNRRPVGKSE